MRPASPQSLAPGRVPGTLYADLSLPDHAFRALQDDALPLYQETILHPAALLTLAREVNPGPELRVLHQHILVSAGGIRLVQHLRHTAIYELRRPAGG